MNSDLAAHYLEEARRQMNGHKHLGEGALSQLSDTDFFVALDKESNSIAVIVKHLAGNMRSRFVDFLTSDGEKPDRHRDQEFELGPSTTRADVMNWWEAGWGHVMSALEGLKPQDVTKTVFIRHEPHSVLQAVNRQIAHYAYHVGQLVFLAKHLHADEWRTLSVPRGKSEEFNRKMAGQKAPQPPASR